MKRLTWSTPMVHEVQDRITPGGGMNTFKVESDVAFGTGELAAGASINIGRDSYAATS